MDISIAWTLHRAWTHEIEHNLYNARHSLDHDAIGAEGPMCIILQKYCDALMHAGQFVNLYGSMHLFAEKGTIAAHMFKEAAHL